MGRGLAASQRRVVLDIVHPEWLVSNVKLPALHSRASLQKRCVMQQVHHLLDIGYQIHWPTRPVLERVE